MLVGSARANSPTIANAMERMMRKVLTVIIKICITGSLICPYGTIVFSRLAISVTVEYRILKGGWEAQVEIILKKVAKVRKNLKFE
ncbi:hypothetical protein [uncultured Mucilaginibacter sp.]|uniref:hypothetical protein n=1 Tax=uncultured Mucilaginibacter sp. TaxID=797541 RepID=UPI0025E2ABC4|nr:hypothetical protein [uncultured Mucilaginibacter sp.]